MAQVRHRDHVAGVVHQPERGVGHAALGQAHAARETLDAFDERVEVVVLERKRERDQRLAAAVLLAPYDLREMAMLGDAGSNALGAVLGLRSVELLAGRRRWAAIGALSLLTAVGERRSLGKMIESTPVLRELDALGRDA